MSVSLISYNWIILGAIISLCGCWQTETEIKVGTLEPIGLTLSNHRWDTIRYSPIFYEWRADVSIVNNTDSDTIWIRQSTENNIIICSMKGYIVRDDDISPVEYSPHSPVSNFTPLLPKESKKFKIAFPMLERWHCADESYIKISFIFLTSQFAYNPVRLVLSDTLEKSTVYQITYNYRIDQNCKMIKPIEEDIDSIFKNKKIKYF